MGLNYSQGPNTSLAGLVAVSRGDGSGSWVWVPSTSLKVTSTKTYYDNKEYSVSGTLAVPSGSGSVPNVGPTNYLPPFPYIFPAGATVTLIQATYLVRSGSCTVTAYKNGSAIAALTSLSVGTSSATTTCSVSVTSGDLFQPYISAVSSADGLSFDFVFQVTL